jgi:hypothetical protein
MFDGGDYVHDFLHSWPQEHVPDPSKFEEECQYVGRNTSQCHHPASLHVTAAENKGTTTVWKVNAIEPTAIWYPGINFVQKTLDRFQLGRRERLVLSA